MIDTIGVGFPVHVDPASWDYRRKNGFQRYDKNLLLENGSKVQLTYYPYIRGGSPWYMMEFSLPHCVFGNNTILVYRIQETIDQANLLLSAIPGIPPLNLWEGVLYRLDICYNHQVGRLVPYFVKSLQTLEGPWRHPSPYSVNGVQYRSGPVTLKFYDKEMERLKKKDDAGTQAARGILRQEITLRKPAVKKLAGTNNPKLSDLTPDLLLDLLESELRQLGLLDQSIGTRTTTHEKLCAIYGKDAGIYYTGLLVIRNLEPSRATTCAATGLHPRSLDRKLKKIADAGIPLTLTETEEPLPPLIIDRELVKRIAEQGLVSKNSM